MKKIFLLLVMTLIGITTSAQAEQGFRNGVQINGGLSNVAGEGDKASFGWGVGWVAEYNFNSPLYLQSGLGLQTIAHKEDGIDGTLRGCFLQLPIHVGYRFSLGDTSQLFVQAGPTIGYGLFGTKIEVYGVKDFNYFDLAKRFDFGLGGRIGVQFSKFQFSIGANYGVLKAFDGDENYHNLSANIGIAYMFK